MFISKIGVTNFKSFDEIEVPLSNFNVLIGANASGKSNFVEIFEFLDDVFTLGLDNAISLKGGRDFIRNVNIGFDKTLRISVEINCEGDEINTLLIKRIEDRRDNNINGSKVRTLFRITRKRYNYKIYNIKYDFEIYFLKTRKDFRVVSENLSCEGNIYEYARGKMSIEKDVRDSIGMGYLNITRMETKLNAIFNTDIEDLELSFSNIIPDFTSYLKLVRGVTKKKLFLESEYMPSFVSSIRSFFRSISIYNIDPRLSKISARFTGKNELELDGNNLVIVLKNLLENKNQKEDFSLLLRSTLPFIEDLMIERFSDKTLIASIKERYSKKKYFPASLMSDGTISVLALIIILYFEEKKLILIEEPERNIHPSLISKLVNMMKDVSNKKQIIITTHNPEIVKYAGLDNLCLVKRDKNGYTSISTVYTIKYLKTFLEEEIGIEELFVDNLLR